MKQKAVEMFTDLKMFQEAKELVEEEGSGREALMSKQADWARHTNDARSAVAMYVDAGEVDKAIEVAACNKWSDV